MVIYSSSYNHRNGITSTSSTIIFNKNLNMKNLLLLIFTLCTFTAFSQVQLLHYNRMFDGRDTIECDVYISVLPDRMYYLDMSGYDEVILTPTVVGDYRTAGDSSSFVGCSFLFFPTKLLIAAECCTKTFWWHE